jgi:SAM-dependent methyltransferase
MVLSKLLDLSLQDIVKSWCQSEEFKNHLLMRENYLCANCIANFRMRATAWTVLRLLGINNTSELFDILNNNPDIRIYETANHSVFRILELKNMPNYVVSEYFENKELGTYVDGILNENLECLTFPDDSFDILITSEVLEHIANLDKALEEIRRVLKPGGYHVFSIPVDMELTNTIERAIISEGKTLHLSPPVYHGDSIRNDGILAFRDFGADTLNYLGRDGLHYSEMAHHRSGKNITSTYYARKEK